ncbi:porin [Loktanella sp. S4079]|uniref:porin n=1 Tax=Loktanella sp. S4079 TaxID=579483 RepID=UPI0005FA7EAB|nr:porin [Loktanella sp. S4079]KJZ19290.1 porin [Loktanella sp. S4079]
MKSILLTSTAIVAFAGAAAAEVSFSGDATLGYNSRVAEEDGFYWDADVAVKLSQELDNGLTAAASFNFEAADADNGQELAATDFVLSLTSETAGLYYGDTAFAAQTLWKSAGDMEADGFSENDGETVLRGEAAYNGIDAAVSYTIADAANNFPADDSHVDQLSVAAAGDFGQFSVVAAYQDESDAAFGAVANTENGDYNPNELFGLSVGASFSGADITVAYAEDLTADESSLGVQVAYPFGPVTATVYYVAEDDATDEDNYGVTLAYSAGAIAVKGDYDYDQGTDKWGIEGSYDVGNGFTVFAGVLNEDESDDADYYVAGTYDLGGGASVLVSFAEDKSNDQGDEVGANEYKEGATVEVNFSF